MGSQICKQTNDNYEFILDPFISKFERCQLQQINCQIQKLFTKIKKIRPDIIDPLKDHSNKWYKSSKHKYKLFGKLNGNKPCGQCLIYQQPPNVSNIGNPQNNITQTSKTSQIILISTNISVSYNFSPKTLLIFSDKSYYIGSIQPFPLNFPKASGNGILITKQFIYQGQFSNGYIEGYGRYKTKKIQYLGYFKKGIPYGQCIEKSSDGIFIGEIDQRGIKKNGYVITNQNQKKQIVQRVQAQYSQFQQNK